MKLFGEVLVHYILVMIRIIIIIIRIQESLKSGITFTEIMI